MAVQSDVTIANQAFFLLGEKPIDNFADGSDRANVAAATYETIKDAILGLHDWKFTMELVQLSKATAAPVAQFTNAFILPTDRLLDGPIAVFPSSAVGAAPITDFDIIGSQLLSDQNEIFINYQSDGTTEDVWPAYFQRLIVKACAADWAYPITDQANLANKLHIEVYGTPAEMQRGGMVAQAMARNSREAPTSVFSDFSLILARAEGS